MFNKFLSFAALRLLVEWQEEHMASKVSRQQKFFVAYPTEFHFHMTAKLHVTRPEWCNMKACLAYVIDLRVWKTQSHSGTSLCSWLSAFIVISRLPNCGFAYISLHCMEKNSFIGAAPTVSNTASYPLPNSYYNWLHPTNLRQTIMLL